MVMFFRVRKIFKIRKMCAHFAMQIAYSLISGHTVHLLTMFGGADTAAGSSFKLRFCFSSSFFCFIAGTRYERDTRIGVEKEVQGLD